MPNIPIPIFFIWFLIAIFIFRHHMRKNSKAQEAVSNAFWKKEESSLVVRKKDLNPEDYIHPTLTEEDFADDLYYHSIGAPELSRKAHYLRELIHQPMVNFAHITNTDLRLTYGTAMLTAIERYEENFNAYITNLYQISEKVLTTGDKTFALKLLEEGINLGTENRKLYLLTAKCYKDMDNNDALVQLLEKAKKLKSLTRDALLRELETLID